MGRALVELAESPCGTYGARWSPSIAIRYGVQGRALSPDQTHPGTLGSYIIAGGEKTLFFLGVVGSRTLGTSLVQFPPALNPEIRWLRLLKEAASEIETCARQELHLAVRVEHYTSSGRRAAFGVHPTLAIEACVFVGTITSSICGRRFLGTAGVVWPDVTN